MAKGHLSIRVEDETRAVLEEIQRDRGPDASLADVVRDALRKYAADYLAGKQATGSDQKTSPS